MSLEDRLNAAPVSAWRPDEDDPKTIVGEILDIEKRDGDWGPYPVLIVRTKDGEEKAIHAMRSVLKNELLKKRPQIGERIGVVYLGEQKGQGTRSYIGYRVEVERNTNSTFSWDTMGEAPQEDAIGRVVYDQPVVTVPDDAGVDDVPF